MPEEILNLVNLEVCPDCMSEELFNLFDEESGDLKGVICDSCGWVYLIEHGVVYPDIIVDEILQGVVN
jgi:uncharacterized protein YbaR (Trm112 family)